METPNDELTQRLKILESEQDRINGMLNSMHELTAQVHQLKTTLIHKKNETKTSTRILTNNEKTTQEKLKTISISHTHSQKHGYVVCLMFHPHSPPEWSGKEWHVHGKGKCYLNSEQAYQCLRQLQKRWPNYPFQVLERQLDSTDRCVRA
ncbi:MAG: hypothetical protein DRR16_11705 [Candidatus Parabeggiatoa sp. nov. 3]|jgi:hypothetical protein|nr:MAG: hypothetical protein DRR00_00610 [Gammaproteobacteria bacterium]RKZ69728.1 MAG: hypothetical protein DRQ99_00025 [Gammaproteobacteria bacterium]RKZ85603.1 MAG: hypothetical protein DRR16_11705 [Gammaproteobacteria bacterium]